MICCIPFFTGDLWATVRLLEWINDLGGCRGHECVLVADFAVPWNDALTVKVRAESVFKDVTLIATDKSVNGWPQGPNNMFLRASSYFVNSKRGPWLFLESDTVPLKSGFLDVLEAEYAKCGAAFMGSLMDFVNGGTQKQLNGVAVYPSDANRLMAGPVLINPNTAFDVSTALAVLPFAVDTPLIHNLWGEKSLPPVFSEKSVPGTNVFCPEQIRTGAVLFHRNKDGSLIRLLRSRLGFDPKPTVHHAASGGPFPFGRMVDGARRVVSLRRAGDIIALLPLLRHISAKIAAPAELVVHKDFLSVIEGASYVKPIIWAGSWEEPIQASKMHRAVNAQVFGKGVPRPPHGMNFVNTAWKMLGFEWDRYLRLDFDRRDLAREERLAASVFKTDKPKILVKLHGFSSPFSEADFLMSALQQFNESAEVVNLDAVKAERIYDLLGLMDRAACMVSIDTATLHLCRASKCPVVALVNGGTFGSSPSVGNVVLRVSYSNVREKINRITEVIRLCLEPDSQGNEVFLVHSEFTPQDEESRARHKRAQSTWGNLSTVILPYSGGRTGKSVSDPHDMPFVKDMIETAVTTFPNSVVAISNNDIGFYPGIREVVLRSCRQFGCYWAYRLNGQSSTTDMGADLFAFTPKWWKLHGRFLPDFLLGYCWWDDMLSRIMLWSGCDEQERFYYHEPHPGAIETRPATAGAVYNERLATEWLKKTGDHRKKPYENL